MAARTHGESRESAGAERGVRSPWPRCPPPLLAPWSLTRDKITFVQWVPPYRHTPKTDSRRTRDAGGPVRRRRKPRVLSSVSRTRHSVQRDDRGQAQPSALAGKFCRVTRANRAGSLCFHLQTRAGRGLEQTQSGEGCGGGAGRAGAGRSLAPWWGGPVLCCQGSGGADPRVMGL